MALIDNIVAYWKMDESSGNAADSTGNGNTLVNNNTVTYAPGIIDNGAVFTTAGNKYFSIANGSITGLNFTSSFTFAGWFKAASSGTDVRFVFKQNDGVNSQYTYFLNSPTSGTYNCNLKLGGSFNAYNATTTVSVSTGTWYHAAVVVDTTAHTMDFYHNGSQVGSTVSIDSGALGTSTDDFLMAARKISGSTNSVYDGMFDEWGAWERALSSSEISQLYNSGSGLSYPFTTPSSISAIDGVAQASITSFLGVANANMASANGVANS